ncbi:hypothetical protein VL2_gp126 [Pseudomonas phage vB_PaeM_VL12]|uniref:Uncharacterized protein n=14 Tax=Nankokuvirus TaxID=1925779 RepID=A0A218L3Z3_9CAUD|nr:hypothetical protein [Pseudomonas aeruginosa]YP_004306780.1 hypothetical protein KPP10_gp030 [Pseudomonas phage KPP10]YP_008856910.1 hypothetical protein X832_gp034 [Pseudomonas phage PAK_P5]YP_008857668.1 hypothetical protein PAK_P30033 [Pseudomonas phage PAK_P3]YP_008858056.1 hypothetical protein X837_gp033 [Pseudomonas phage CHA_P1]YP_009124485.1 hypothetical protein VC54_gp122 [Pseudomonas phage vB_PaeM_PAO1_Ab03]YP_009206045.1 hypothetical protein AVT15_gp121 [Pseudomonas phage vB_Pae
MTKAHEITVLGMLFATLLTLVVGLGVLVYYAQRVTSTEYQFDIIRKEYRLSLEEMRRDFDIRTNRLQEQINAMQYTTSKQMRLLQEEQDNLKRKR